MYPFHTQSYCIIISLSRPQDQQDLQLYSSLSLKTGKIYGAYDALKLKIIFANSEVFIYQILGCENKDLIQNLRESSTVCILSVFLLVPDIEFDTIEIKCIRSIRCHGKPKHSEFYEFNFCLKHITNDKVWAVMVCNDIEVGITLLY